MNKFLFFLLMVSHAKSQQKEIAPKVFRINISQDFHQQDPRKTADLTSCGVHFLVYEGLTKMTPSSSEPVLALADQVIIDSSETVYTFKLQDRKYSNGKSITAYDFENSRKKALDPNFFCPNIHLFFPIKNAKKCKQGLISIDSVGLKAIDKKTFQVTLENPLDCFLEIIAFSTFAPYPEDNSFSGVFKIDSFIINQELVLNPNPYHPNYKSIQQPICISFIKDEMTAFNLFEKGKLDLIGTPFTAIPKDVLEQSSYQSLIKQQPTSGVCHLIVNRSHQLFSDRPLFSSIYENIDRNIITKEIVNLEGKETKYIIPNSIFLDHESLTLPVQSKSKKHPITATLIYPQNGSYSKLAQYIQYELASKWNVQITLQPLETKHYLHRMKNHDFDLALNTLYIQYRDPLSVLDRFYDLTNAKNYARFENTSYQKLINESQNSKSTFGKTQNLKQAEKILLEESGIIPLFLTSTSYLTSPQIKGVEVNYTGGFNFENVVIEVKTP